MRLIRFNGATGTSLVTLDDLDCATYFTGGLKAGKLCLEFNDGSTMEIECDKEAGEQALVNIEAELRRES